MKTSISRIAGVILFAIIITAGNVRATEHDAKASSHENIEASLELENWMIDSSIWNNFPSYSTENKLKVELNNKENWEVIWENLELEGWMVNSSLWDVYVSDCMEPETEANLILENWMVNEKTWEI